MNDLEDNMSKKTYYRREKKAGKWLPNTVQSVSRIGNVQEGEKGKCTDLEARVDA